MKAGRPDGKGHQGSGGRVGVGGRKGAVLEQDPDDRRGKGDQRRRRRAATSSMEISSDWSMRRLRLGVAAALQVPAEFGQQHHADGDADDAERQLIEPVGVIEIGDGAGRPPRR